MRMRKISQGPNEEKRPPSWETVMADAEKEIDLVKARIQRLEGIIRFCKRMIHNGEKFPSNLNRASDL